MGFDRGHYFAVELTRQPSAVARDHRTKADWASRRIAGNANGILTVPAHGH
jgi:hypothetical protein